MAARNGAVRLGTTSNPRTTNGAASVGYKNGDEKTTVVGTTLSEIPRQRTNSIDGYEVLTRGSDDTPIIIPATVHIL